MTRLVLSHMAAAMVGADRAGKRTDWTCPAFFDDAGTRRLRRDAAHPTLETMPSTLTDEENALIARALADPRRCRMLMQIGAEPGPLACSALSGAHEVSAATISHHLKELEAAGLIEIRRDGRCAQLAIRRDRLRAYAELIASL